MKLNRNKGSALAALTLTAAIIAGLGPVSTVQAGKLSNQVTELRKKVAEQAEEIDLLKLRLERMEQTGGGQYGDGTYAQGTVLKLGPGDITFP